MLFMYVSLMLVWCMVLLSLWLSKGYVYVEVLMNGLDFISDRIIFTLYESVKFE